VGKTSCKKFSPHPFQELSQHFLCVKVFIFSVRLRYTADSCRGATTLKNLAKSNIFHENVWMLLSNHAGSGTPHPSPAVTPVSLRLGHARVLTAHRAVIHCPRAASLPRGGRLSWTSPRERWKSQRKRQGRLNKRKDVLVKRASSLLLFQSFLGDGVVWRGRGLLARSPLPLLSPSPSKSFYKREKGLLPKQQPLSLLINRN